MPTIIQFTKTMPKQVGVMILPVIDGKHGKLKDHLSAPLYKRAKKELEDNKPGTKIMAGNDGDNFTTYIIANLGKNPGQLDFEKAGGQVFKRLSDMHEDSAVCADLLSPENGAAFANGIFLRSYDFKKYKTRGEETKSKDIQIKMITSKKANAERCFATIKAVSDAVFVARNFVNEPPNTLYPQSYVTEIKKLFKGTNVKITVFDEKKLDKMGAGALLAVGKGSERQPRLVTLEYDGRKSKEKSDKPLALIGKGVTFDTGGYSLKPAASMGTMKMDMGGSAAVIGAIKALSDNKDDVFVVGAVALAENMIAGNAYRVDDVLVSLSGQTIEVGNTDAEGRLCLADALTHVQDKYDPRAIVDIATLTGACMAALGLEMAGVFSNDKKLQDSFWKNGETTGDDFWPLPVNKDFDKLMDSDIADMRNISSSPFGGASTAAVFLQRFITNDRPWAHLDIAGTAWRKGDNDLHPKGASGFGVRALYHWATTYK